MGSRTQVLVKDNGVYLYDHWGRDFCEIIIHSIQSALRRDPLRSFAGYDYCPEENPDYLAAEILQKMGELEAQRVASIQSPSDPAEAMFYSFTGLNENRPFEIGTKRHDDIELLITIDCEKRTIEINPIKMGKVHNVSIDDFLETDLEILAQYCNPHESKENE